MTEHFSYQGQHRVWHVVRPTAGEEGGTGRAKFSEPRADALWFDLRSFDVEEALLAELAALGMDAIPSVRPIGDGGEGHPLLLQNFIEGRALSEVAPAGTPVEPWHLADVVERFRQLARVRPEHVRTPRGGEAHEPVRDGDTAHFLRTLLTFTRERVYHRRRPTHGALFDALGLPPHALAPGSRLGSEADALTRRPFCLLHGDLHRANFIVDRADGRLWTIDWELALVGDPLYDLATHLHLMGYPEKQEDEVTARWSETVPVELPGAGDGMEDDLPRYLAYKRVQSVYTDVVRHAQKLRDAAPGERTARSEATGAAIHRLLLRAAAPLGLHEVPCPRAVASVFETLVPAAPGRTDARREGPAATSRPGRRGGGPPAAPTAGGGARSGGPEPPAGQGARGGLGHTGGVRRVGAPGSTPRSGTERTSMTNAPQPQSDEPAHDPEVLELAQRIFGLARSGDRDTIVAYVEAGVPANLTSDEGDSLVMIAARHGHAEAVRALLERGGDPDRTDGTGRTPLAGAVLDGADAVLDALLEGGADPRAGTPSAVEAARMSGRDELVARFQA